MPLRTARALMLYALTWVPYTASYYVIFKVGGPAAGIAMVEAVANVLPAALLGLAVLTLLQRLPWPTSAPVRFAVAHTLLVFAYAITWLALTQLLLAGISALSTHQWTLPRWGLYAVQWQVFSGVMIYCTLAGFAYMFQAQSRAQVEQERRLEAEALRVRAELNALRSQLNPHFFFNALHSVTALVSINPEKAETALMDLSRMLRYALASHADAQQDEVSLREELAFTDAYLALEALRLGQRLRVERDIGSETLDCILPSLTLQPLVENAIKHSISPRPEGGRLFIATQSDHGALVIRVSDDGSAAAPDLSQCAGLGLRNISRRLDLFYKQLATMHIEGGAPTGFSVTLRLPQEEKL